MQNHKTFVKVRGELANTPLKLFVPENAIGKKLVQIREKHMNGMGGENLHVTMRRVHIKSHTARMLKTTLDKLNPEIE